ncbi:hypothetical protein K440DRAFT_642567 [Wilcoxina mikolae CBS 423.85]|nr:hypothetical protein K440DRAFT_642567 [Wilcoxina mikolae CBS 423.85]
MKFTPVNESSSTATAIKESALHTTITVKNAGSVTHVDEALATATRYRNIVSPTIVTPDTADSARSPPAMSPPTKLSYGELSSTKPFHTMDLIPVTIKSTMNNAPATLLCLVLESLFGPFFPDRHFHSIQQAVEIAMKKLTPHYWSKFRHGIYELFADVHDVSNAKFAWRSKFE